MEEQVQSPVLRGAEAIARVAKVNRDEIPRLVREERFPAYKRDGIGPWLCRVEDIDAWHMAQRDRYRASLDNGVNT